MFIKINNLLTVDGNADYKGLDIQKIVPGSQLYPVGENYCMVEYDGEVLEHQDILKVSKSEHDALKVSMQSNQPKSEMDLLKEENQALNNAVVELYEIVLGGM